MLTRKDFYDYLISKGCKVGDFEGINRTATRQIEIINSKTGKYFYIATPINDLLVESFVVKRACLILGIELPSNY